MINWKEKLTSRKLWAAIIAVIMAVCVVIFEQKIDPELVMIVEDAVTALCVYIGGESVVDAVRQIFTKKEE